MTCHARQPKSDPRRVPLAAVIVAALTLTACGSSAGGGGSTLPSVTASVPDRTGVRTSDAAGPTDATTAEPPGATTTVTSTPNPRPSGPATIVITPAPSAEPSAEPAPAPASESKANAPLWIILVAVILLAVLIGMLIARSQRKARLAALLATLTADTRTTMDSSVTQILAVSDPGSRSLSWPAVDARLVALQNRWAAIAADASEADAQKARELSRRIGELLVAVRAENDALLQGLDWALLRPRVDQERAAITGVLVQFPPGVAP